MMNSFKLGPYRLFIDVLFFCTNSNIFHNLFVVWTFICFEVSMCLQGPPMSMLLVMSEWQNEAQRCMTLKKRNDNVFRWNFILTPLLMFRSLEAIDQMTKDPITDVNIYLTMSCSEHIFHGVRGISIDRIEQAKQQPEFITRKSLLIFAHAMKIFLFSARNADADANDQLTSGNNPYVVWDNKHTHTLAILMHRNVHSIIINHKMA